VAVVVVALGPDRERLGCGEEDVGFGAHEGPDTVNSVRKLLDGLAMLCSADLASQIWHRTLEWDRNEYNGLDITASVVSCTVRTPPATTENSGGREEPPSSCMLLHLTFPFPVPTLRL
jgi:hypothetical protein